MTTSMLCFTIFLWNLLHLGHSQCPTAFYSYDNQFCEVSFDTYEQSCTSLDDIYSYYSYGLAMDPLNGEIYMAVSIDPEDEFTERAIIKFDQSSPNNYTILARYDYQSEFMAGLTFGGCGYDAATDEYISTLYAISGVYATGFNKTIIWKVDKTTGEMTTFVEISNWHRHGRAIAYSPFVDKFYLIDCSLSSFWYSCNDVWQLLELDPNDDEVTRVSSEQLDVVAEIEVNGYGNYYTFAVFNESHILVVGSYDTYLVDIGQDYSNVVCVGGLDGYGIKGCVCDDMLQDYQNFAMCPNTTIPKLESDRVNIYSQVCTQFTPTYGYQTTYGYDSSESSTGDTPIGWIMFSIVTICVCLFAVYKNDYVAIWCGRKKSLVKPVAAIELEMHAK